MSEKDKIYEQKVNYTGPFDFKNVYNFLYTMLIDTGYQVEEKAYKEKSIGGAKEIEIVWQAKRKISDYFRFQINIGWRILGMKDVEVMKDGKRVKMNEGNPEIKFQAFLERDYENKWEGTALFRFLRGVYDKFVVKKTIEGYEKKLIDEVSDLINQTKAYLVLEGKR